MGNAELENKIALVTGGSNGIGLETVKLLANKGATVIVGYYNGEERAKDIINSLPNKNHMIHQIKLEDYKTAEGVAEVINQSFGKLDILINSAGFTKPVPHKDLSSLDIELFDKIPLANTRGPYSVIRSLMPLLENSDDAVVINVSFFFALNHLRLIKKRNYLFIFAPSWQHQFGLGYHICQSNVTYRKVVAHILFR